MPRRSSYRPGQLAGDSTGQRIAHARVIYQDVEIPADHDRAIELIDMHDITGSPNNWPPRERQLRDDTILSPGMLVVTIFRREADLDCQLWVYCGRRMWLPVSGVFTRHYEPSHTRTRSVSLQHIVAGQAVNWLLVTPEHRVALACLEAVYDLLRHYQFEDNIDARNDCGTAIANVLTCADATPYGRAGILQAANAMVATAESMDLVQLYTHNRRSMTHLVNRVPPQHRYPLLEVFAGQLGLRLDTPPEGRQGKQSAVKTNSRHVRFNLDGQVPNQPIA